MIIDCHGHYTTAPKALEVWRDAQLANLNTPELGPKVSDLKISDDEIRESIENNQLARMRERGIDVTIFSPRASYMAHHIGDFNTSATWTAICNELCYRVTQLFPEHFVGAAMLPQSPGVDISTCLPEMRKCINEYQFVGINLNPDPSGGHWRDPPLSYASWHPIYEEMVSLDVPAMIHVSTSCNDCFHTTGAHYLNADTTAFMQCLTSDLFERFPELRFLIPHGGGAVPFHWGRFRGLAKDMHISDINQKLLNNIYFDTCVYHQPGIDLLTKVIPVKNILFASETFGAVKDVDPNTGHYFDDTRRYVDAVNSLNEHEKQMIFEGNARKVFSRIDRRISASKG
jgi:4-oxalmesaconate hydratase